MFQIFGGFPGAKLLYVSRGIGIIGMHINQNVLI